VSYERTVCGVRSPKHESWPCHFLSEKTLENFSIQVPIHSFCKAIPSFLTLLHNANVRMESDTIHRTFSKGKSRNRCKFELLSSHQLLAPPFTWTIKPPLPVLKSCLQYVSLGVFNTFHRYNNDFWPRVENVYILCVFLYINYFLISLSLFTCYPSPTPTHMLILQSIYQS
jgi:hypothetical protein